MNKTLTLITAISVITLCGCSPSGGTPQAINPVADPDDTVVEAPADFIFTNASVYTVNPDQEWAEAVAVRGNEIVYVGDSDGVAAFAGDGTQAVDLGGRLMLPGFVESHVHLAIGGATTSGVILAMNDSLENVLRKVKEYAETHPEKETIFGASYSAFLFDKGGPNKSMLDEIIPDRPVYLMDHTLHAVWVNSKTLKIAKITKDTTNPPGGEYVRDENGDATGAIKGGPAYIPVSNAVGAITAESMMSSLPGVIEGMSEFGFTSAIDMGAPIATDAAYEAMYKLSRDARAGKF